jgi:hypothetical protein
MVRMRKHRAAYRWTFSGLDPGEYVVSVWIPDDPNSDHASDAHYTVCSDGRQYEATADQSKDFQTWRSLGTFALGSDGNVELNRARKPCARAMWRRTALWRTPSS